jgi:hypothetical protein
VLQSWNRELRAGPTYQYLGQNMFPGFCELVLVRIRIRRAQTEYEYSSTSISYSYSKYEGMWQKQGPPTHSAHMPVFLACHSSVEERSQMWRATVSTLGGTRRTTSLFCARVYIYTRIYRRIWTTSLELVWSHFSRQSVSLPTQ